MLRKLDCVLASLFVAVTCFMLGVILALALEEKPLTHRLKGERDSAELYLKDVQLGSGGWTNQCVAHFYGENGGEYYVQHSPFGGGLRVTYYDQDKDGNLRINTPIHLSGAGLNPLFAPPPPLSPTSPVVWIVTIEDGAPNGDGTGEWCVYDESGLEVCSASSKRSARHRALLAAKERKITIRLAELHGDAVWQYFDKAKTCPDCGDVIRSDGPDYGLEELDVDEVIREVEKQQQK